MHLVEEIDCVRIISDLKHEIVQKVPNMIQEMFRINSTSVGHYLFEAFNKFKVFCKYYNIINNADNRAKKLIFRKH